MRLRIKEGIISSENGDKSFDEIYGNGIETTPEDDINSSRYAHCFESVSIKSGKTKLNESEEATSEHDWDDALEI